MIHVMLYGIKGRLKGELSDGLLFYWSDKRRDAMFSQSPIHDMQSSRN